MTKRTAVVCLLPLLAFFVAVPLVARPPGPDEGRAQTVAAAETLADFLPGTKWLMYNRRDRVLEFRRDGKFALADWARQGIEAEWSVTGPNQVTITVTSDKFKGLTAVFNFDEHRTSFTGHDLDKKREVTRSPRAPHQMSRETTSDGESHQRSGPERILPLTGEQLLTKVPQFYAFDYDADPQPGKRYWLRVNNTTWIERYPDGLEGTFKVIGHANVEDTEGTIVVKVAGSRRRTETDNHGGLQAFIPDKGSAVMHHWYRNIDRGDTEWNDLGPMLNVE